MSQWTERESQNYEEYERETGGKKGNGKKVRRRRGRQRQREKGRKVQRKSDPQNRKI